MLKCSSILIKYEVSKVNENLSFGFNVASTHYDHFATPHRDGEADAEKYGLIRPYFFFDRAIWFFYIIRLNETVIHKIVFEKGKPVLFGSN